MVEWSITAVLKTAVLRGTGGSNPSLSAKSDVTSCYQRVTSLFRFALINICATLELDVEQTSFTRWNDELKDVNYAELHENSKW